MYIYIYIYIYIERERERYLVPSEEHHQHRIQTRDGSSVQVCFPSYLRARSEDGLELYWLLAQHAKPFNNQLCFIHTKRELGMVGCPSSHWSLRLHT